MTTDLNTTGSFWLDNNGKRPEEDLQANLKLEQDRLIELEHAKNSKHKQARIDSCKQRITLIQKALTKDLMEVA